MQWYMEKSVTIRLEDVSSFVFAIGLWNIHTLSDTFNDYYLLFE